MRRIALCVMAALFIAGCSRESEKPKASVEVHVGNDKGSLENALDDAGRSLKKGAKEAEAKLKDAGDAIKDKVDAAKDKLSDDKKAEVKVQVKD